MQKVKILSSFTLKLLDPCWARVAFFSACMFYRCKTAATFLYCTLVRCQNLLLIILALHCQPVKGCLLCWEKWGKAFRSTDSDDDAADARQLPLFSVCRRFNLKPTGNQYSIKHSSSRSEETYGTLKTHYICNTTNPTPKPSSGKRFKEWHQSPVGKIKDMQSASLFELGHWHFSFWSIMWHIRVVLKAQLSDNNRAAVVSISQGSAEIWRRYWPLLLKSSSGGNLLLWRRAMADLTSFTCY